MLTQSKSYSRRNNIIYEDGTPIIRLAQNFIDAEDLKPETIDYMNRYLAQSDKLYEIIPKPMNKSKIVKLFYDLETTGTDPRKHSIHHISGIIEVDGEVAEEFDFKVKPHPKAQISPEAMKVGNVNETLINSYPDMKTIYHKIIALLGKYADRYDVRDKIWLAGFNNRAFDDIFFRAWFEQNGDTFFGAWFWTDSLDVMVQASEYLIDRRKDMPNFKLKTVARELGILVDEDKLHDAKYDVFLTREIYRVVTGREVEI